MTLLHAIARPVIRKLRGPPRVGAGRALDNGSIAERTVDGTAVRWLITNAGDDIQSAQLRDGFYELADLRRLAEDVGPVRTVLDVGANIGNHAVFFTAMMGVKELVLIEPFSEAADHLMVNLALNSSNIQTVILHRCALGASEGTASLFPPTEFNIGLTRVEFHDHGQGEVRVATGDQLKFSTLDLLKIDVEGTEMEVLRGLENTIRTHKPAIYLETSRETRQTAVSFLKSLSYRLHRAAEAYETQFNLTFLAN